MVYVMQAGVRGPVKIGHVRGDRAEVERRRRALQCGCPQELTTLAVAPGEAEIEGVLHRFFDNFHMAGEWFRFDSATLAAYSDPDAPMGDEDLITWIANAMLWSLGSELYVPWPEAL